MPSATGSFGFHSVPQHPASKSARIRTPPPVSSAESGVAAAEAADEHGGGVRMRADLLAGCYGTEWNPKDPVALGTDYRCCSEGMWRDRMDPDGRPLGLLITQRSRVQIPPPPPRLTSTFGASPPPQKDSRMWLLSVICQWRARASVRAVLLSWNRRESGWPRRWRQPRPCRG